MVISMGPSNVLYGLSFLLIIGFVQFSHALSIQAKEDCYCFPGEPCWPSISQWAAFNRTLKGRLIATDPIGSVCHSDGPFGAYNASACEDLRAKWDLTSTHYESSSSIMAGFYTNQSCNPFLGPSSRCIIGTYVQYAVRVESSTDIQKTIAFATANRIRLVVRNTGHDYLGKSTGAGAIALWTHHLKDIEFLDYQSSYYNGSAIKVGAGVQVGESNAAASKRNFTVVGGNCRTIGLAGGYSQGGGHGQLVSRFGLAADQVLSWEVVTPTGVLVTATPDNEYSDLYWALAGGGGGTYGVVVSMISLAHPEMQTATAELIITTNSTTRAAFNDVFDIFMNSTLGPLLDARGASVWYITSEAFELTPITIPGGTKKQLEAILAPMLKALKRTNLPYTYQISSFPTFYTSFEKMSPVVNVTEYNVAGRFVPRHVLDREPRTVANRLRRIASYGAAVSGVSVNASLSSPGQAIANSVNPGWREAAIDVVLGLPLSQTNQSLDAQHMKTTTDVLLPYIESITPGAGAYLNEADVNQPHWQQTFYGDKYERLLKIKQKYDPRGLLYAATAVGSESWVQREDGRLCRR
ncbi:FAD/FMN-containing dehydrogenase [Penicillium longicatenatum]|uniref:FAD/FMN-containing dehydrogenase n=1 Tax=Penicillium longicatenatum TaxID=1561947 RepID=UPI002548E9BB|nr:FAD/FMN-containing dehydrogenase [Penicillium longicatenatum]KAJ5630613.1 FAD/FMN-containing dehydrogenase [Penicillium longicatenatum]